MTDIHSDIDAGNTRPIELDSAASAPWNHRLKRRVIVLGTDEKRVADESIDALAALGILYQHDRHLLEVFDFNAFPRGMRVPPAPRVRELLSEAAVYVRRSVDMRTLLVFDRNVHVPDWCVRAVRARGVWPGIPSVYAGLNRTGVS